MANNSVVTQEQFNADIQRFYEEDIYPYLNGAMHTGCVPLGTIIPYYGETAPDNFLICDGTTYNKADYPELAAHLLSLTDTTPYVVSGDSTKFKVPDLRGEFLRGTGTNSHTNQGSGANVGVHQDSTIVANIGLQNVSGNQKQLYLYPNSWRSSSNFDSVIQDGAKTCGFQGTISDGTSTAFGSIRPTNTSVLYCIAYRNAYIDLALDGFPIAISQPTDGQLLMYDATAGRWVNGGHKYSTTEHVVGTWIDGKPIYEKTVAPFLLTLNNVADPTAWKTYDIGIPNNIDFLVNSDFTFMGYVFKQSAVWDGNIQINCSINTTNYLLHVQTKYARDTQYLGVTFQYTKTTD